MINNNNFDDLPKRSETHDIEKETIRAFENAIAASDYFITQGSDSNDYGTDIQLEVRDGPAMTNIRVHVQLKGTTTKPNRDGSISISVARKNVNYLFNQPHSIYICYHLPSKKLLCKFVEEIVYDYNNKCIFWENQKSITIKFSKEFTNDIQKRLHDMCLNKAKTSRNSRYQWLTAQPEELPRLIANTAVAIDVPIDPKRAYELLVELYNSKEDMVISASFPQFEAILGSVKEAFYHAYLSEINLAINGYSFDQDRVKKAIPILEYVCTKNIEYDGYIIYSLGNAYLALCEYEKARDMYLKAIAYHSPSQGRNAYNMAMCYKNMGAVYEKLDDITHARESYEKALEFNPNLPEAKFALATCLCKDEAYEDALSLLDSIVWDYDSLHRSLTVHGSRILIYFKLGKISEAFREINTLLSYSEKFDWIFPWCARKVGEFGYNTIESIQKSLVFWDKYLEKFPEDITARHRHLLCLWHLHEENLSVEINLEQFKQEVLELIKDGHSEPSFLWERIGQWARVDKNWDNAEEAFRKAWELGPEEYGYWYGYTLNKQGKFDEALPILTAQVEQYTPDEFSWTQIAHTYEGLGNQKKCIHAYQQAIAINPEYETAWFDLGGMYWNYGERHKAFDTWKEAIERFPESEFIEKVQQAIKTDPSLPLLTTPLEGV